MNLQSDVWFEIWRKAHSFSGHRSDARGPVILDFSEVLPNLLSAEWYICIIYLSIICTLFSYMVKDFQQSANKRSHFSGHIIWYFLP